MEPLQLKKCPCGKELRPEQKYCSEECFNEYDSERPDEENQVNNGTMFI